LGSYDALMSGCAGTVPAQEVAMLRRTSRSFVVPLLSVAILVFLASAAAAQVSPPPSSGAGGVPPAELAKLLPAFEGWARGEVRTIQVELSAECAYTCAFVALVKGDTRVKLTLADTRAHADALAALAALVVTLPEGSVTEVPPATTIKRLKIDGSPAAEMWDAGKKAGEITVVVGDRFVVTVEAQKAESLDTLRAVLASVDLKSLAALK
jgi:hypothetical protein